MNPKLIVEQKITAFVNRYAVYSADAQGNKGPIVAFAEQKRFAFKEQVNFYSDETKTTVAFTMKAEKVFDVHGKYLVTDSNGKPVGAFRKAFGKSLLNSTWSLLDSNDQPLLEVKENSQALAIIRRFGGMLPVVGDLVEIIVLFFKYHFKFTMAGSEEVVGKYEKTTLFRDHYKLSMTDQAYAAEDWRVYAALAVALDALQSR
jgi:hypothetical protein